MKQSTIERLRAAQLGVSSMIETCSSTNKVSALKVSLSSTVDLLNSVLDHFQESGQNRALSKTRKSIVSVRNVADGLLTGLAGQDLTVKQFRSIVSNLENKFVSRMGEAIASEVKALPEPLIEVDEDAPKSEQHKAIREVVLSGGTLHDMLKTVREKMVEINRAAVVPQSAAVDPEDEEDDPKDRSRLSGQDAYYQREKEQAERHLMDLNRFKSQFPTSLKSHGDSEHSFTMVKMPIVPLFDQWSPKQESILKKLGIPHIPLAGYMIFEDQLLLVVSRKAAMKATEKITKRKAKPKAPVIVGGKVVQEKIPNKRMLDFKREDQRVADYAETILEIINESHNPGSSYSMVSTKVVANPRNQDLVCFWVMNTKKLSALLLNSGIGAAKVKSWGFPWVDGTTAAPKQKAFVHPSDNPEHPQYLEYAKNSHLRPPGWKTSDVRTPRTL